MLIIGTDLFKVFPDELMKNETNSEPEEFAEELNRIMKSWDFEERMLFVSCITASFERATTKEEWENGGLELLLKTIIR